VIGLPFIANLASEVAEMNYSQNDPRELDSHDVPAYRRHLVAAMDAAAAPGPRGRGASGCA
jgi:hypothetical protein